MSASAIPCAATADLMHSITSMAIRPPQRRQRQQGRRREPPRRGLPRWGPRQRRPRRNHPRGLVGFRVWDLLFPAFFAPAIGRKRIHRLERHDALDVVGVREHVDGLHRHNRIAYRVEKLHVTRLRLGVAGDVDNPLRGECRRCAQKLLRRARARRVHKHDKPARLGAFFRQFRIEHALLRKRAHEVGGVAGDELRVLDTVVAGVRPRIAESPTPPSRRQSRAPRPTSPPQGQSFPCRSMHRLRPGCRQSRKIHRRAVEHFRLRRVHLVKRLG